MTTLVSRTQILLATKAAVAAGIAWAVALLADPRWRGDRDHVRSDFKPAGPRNASLT